jgi:hypothetical protein
MIGLLRANRSVAFTPVATFATPGDLAITYSQRQADWSRNGRLITVNFTVKSSAFTFTTASGTLRITGLPFTASSDTDYFSAGSVIWGGITKAGYTQVNPFVLAGESVIRFAAGASASAASDVLAADTPTAGTLLLRGSVTYRTDA